MPLLSSSKKVEQFAKLLDGSASSGSGEMTTLEGLASRLSSVPQPRAEFASALRDRLMSEAATTLPSAASGVAGSGVAGSGAAGSGTGTASGSSTSAATAAGSGSSAAAAAGSATSAASAAGGSAVTTVLSATAPVWAQFIGIVAATTIAIGGVGLGAAQSLPGDPLYGVKRQVEAIQLNLAGGSTDSAFAQLGFARARLSEISELLDGHAAGVPLSADLQQHVRELLIDWAGETSRGTTVLLDQLSAAKGDIVEIRARLINFTDGQARSLAGVVQQLPDTRLQSLTGSAFAYLQRVDTALGNPVDLARLLQSLGLALPTTLPTASGSTAPTTSSSGQAPTTGGTSSTATPSTVPTLPIPTGGRAVPRPTTPGSPGTPSLPSLPNVGGTGSLPGKVGGAVGGLGSTVPGTTSGVTQTVDGVLEGVTGNGPSLPLPTTVPTLPGGGR